MALQGLSIVPLCIRLKDPGDQGVHARRRRHARSPGANSGLSDTTAVQVVLDSHDDVTGVGLVRVGAGTPGLAFPGKVILEADLVVVVFGGSIRGGSSPTVLEAHDGGESRVFPAVQEGLIRARVHHGVAGGSGASGGPGHTGPTAANALLHRVELWHLSADSLHPSVRNPGKAVIRLDAQVLAD